MEPAAGIDKMNPAAEGNYEALRQTAGGAELAICSGQMEPAMGIHQMKPALYKAAVEGKPEDYYKALRQMTAEGADCEVAQNGNTVLHVAVLYGNKHFVEKILEEEKDHAASSMLFARNNKNETVLHCAAEKGYADIVSVLIKATKEYKDLESGVGVKEMIQMMDDVMDTALHKAARMGHLEVVKLLVKEDDEFLYPANDVGETPVYMAADQSRILFIVWRKC